MKKTAIALAVLAGTLVATGAFAQSATQILNRSAVNSVKELHTHQLVSALNADCVAGTGEKDSCFGMGVANYAATNVFAESNTVNAVYSYQLDQRLRIGATVETENSNFIPANKTLTSAPMFGVFAVWRHDGNALGPAIRLSAGRQTEYSKYVNEQGYPTYMQAQGAQLEFNTSGVTESGVFLQPYVGLRTTEFIMFNPLNAQAVLPALRPSRQDTITGGVRGAYQMTETVGLTFGIGLERDLAKRLEGSGANERTRYVGDAGVAFRTARESQIEVALGYADQSWNEGASTLLKVGFKQAF